jgi:SanA protein
MMIKITMKRISICILICICAAAGAIVFCNCAISHKAKPHVYSNIKDLPPNKVGLLLGTSKYLSSGALNPYFRYRLEAAALLYRERKIRYIIASGDNRTHFYNEPKIMKKELMMQGVPEEAIYLDYAGFRTLDSVVRCSRIFGQESFTIISQRFHNERAVYIARHLGIAAVGFNADDVEPVAAFKTRMREYFARVKAFIDLYLTNEKPRYLGETITIP